MDPEKILEYFSTNVAEALAFALIQPCIDAREAGEDIFGLNSPTLGASCSSPRLAVARSGTCRSCSSCLPSVI